MAQKQLVVKDNTTEVFSVDDDGVVVASGSITTNGNTVLAGTISAAATEIFDGSTTTDIHGAAGTITPIVWDVGSTNNGTYINSFTTGVDSEFEAVGAQEWAVQASLVVVNSTANDRTAYQIRFDHLDGPGGTLIRRYITGGMYIRDDAGAYDEGSMGGHIRLFMADGDVLVVKALVMDEQDAGAGTAPCTAAQSLINIDRITYSAA